MRGRPASSSLPLHAQLWPGHRLDHAPAKTCPGKATTDRGVGARPPQEGSAETAGSAVGEWRPFPGPPEQLLQ